MNPAVTILNVPIHDVTLNEACEHAERLILAGGVHQFATVNPEFVMLAQHDAAFMDVLRRTALNVPDGTGILWAAQRKRQPFVLCWRAIGYKQQVRLCSTDALDDVRRF